MSTAVNPLTAISTWSIDAAHSSVHFKVRHMMIANVRGEFCTVRGDLNLNEADITQSRIDIEIDTSSIHTRDEQRDTHLRSPDFLDTERHPLLTFRSTKVEKAGADALSVRGDLSIHGITRNVELDVDSISPATNDPWGNIRMAASASTLISRKDFGLTWNAALETGGVLVGDEVTIDLDVQFVKSQA
jgi:polyisoprenoid-binding protein YceI